MERKRITSIDLLRGVVMIIMALDHTRDYFHAGAFVNDPTDLHKTTLILFLTRWITHFCAPVFILLAGTSAFISGQRKTKKELSLFLLKRGIWLIFLELTILNFGWYFNIHFSFVNLQVIWVLGACMVFLSGLIYLPGKIILITGLVLVVGHNLLDNCHVSGNGLAAFAWSILHERHSFEFGSTNINITYPLLPWVGWMALGYCLGNLFAPGFNGGIRKGILICLSSASIVLFIILRCINTYGDPAPWSRQSSTVFSVLSFINVTKYPPSLDYLLITGGIALLFLAFTENLSNRITKIISVYGRVPMLYYLIHIYFIHLLAIPAVVIAGYQWTDMAAFTKGLHAEPKLKLYGYNLGIVYLVWITVVISLYPLCKWYDAYKMKHKEKWWPGYL
ncbi:MAG: heparan-alpha-glucosaminide N-acetyltransferase domain-containing protein [Chitinophagaceae bacterium]